MLTYLNMFLVYGLKETLASYCEHSNLDKIQRDENVASRSLERTKLKGIIRKKRGVYKNRIASSLPQEVRRW